MTDEDKRDLDSPLCHTPTSQILKLAAQFLPTTTEPLPVSQTDTIDQNPTPKPDTSPSHDILDLLKHGWWKEGSQSAAEGDKDNGQSMRTSTEAHGKDSCVSESHHAEEHNVSLQANSVSATVSLLRRQAEEKAEKKVGNNQKEGHNNTKPAKQIDGKNVRDDRAEVKKQPIALCPRPLQPGSYWFSKYQSEKPAELPSTSPEDVRKVLASLSSQKVRHPSRDETRKQQESHSRHVSQSDLDETLKPQTEDAVSKQLTSPITNKPAADGSDTKRIQGKARKQVFIQSKIYKPDQHKDQVHKLENCIAEDCMCYEAVFREDHEFATSTAKSDSSVSSNQSNSPKKSSKVRQEKLSSGSQSDESQSSPLSRQRRSRIAAKFEHPVSTQ